MCVFTSHSCILLRFAAIQATFYTDNCYNSEADETFSRFVWTECAFMPMGVLSLGFLARQPFGERWLSTYKHSHNNTHSLTRTFDRYNERILLLNCCSEVVLFR